MINREVTKESLMKALDTMNSQYPTLTETLGRLKGCIVQLNEKEVAFHIDVADPDYLEMMAIGAEAYEVAQTINHK